MTSGARMRTTLGSALVPGENALVQQGVAHGGRRPVADETEQQAHALDTSYRPDDAGLPDLGFARPDVLQQLLALDRVENRRDRGGRDRPAAERRTQVSHAETVGDPCGADNGAAGYTAAKSLWRS